MGTLKEHRAPVRYSLKPDENREIVSLCEKRGHITGRQMKGFASRFGCSQKTVHQAVERHGFDVIGDAPTGAERKPRHIEEARRRAESHFTSPKSKYPPEEPSPPKSDPEVESLDLLAQEEQKLLDAFKLREAEMLEAVSDLERQLAEQSAEVEKERERAREAIQQTRRMRIATRSDREALEETRGELTSMRLKYGRLEKEVDKIKAANTEIKKELRASVQREKRLIEALRLSESDLEKSRNMS